MLRLEVYNRLGQSVGVIPDSSQAKLSERLSKTNTLTFQVEATRQSFEMLPPLLAIVCAVDQEISNTEPRFVGPVISRQVAADDIAGTKYTINCADPSWILANRRIGLSSTGFVVGSQASPAGRDAILRLVLAALGIDGSTNDYAATGISLGSIDTMMPTWVKLDPFTAASDAIQQLGQTLDGFDWRIRPTRPTPTSGATTPRMGYFDAAPTLGSDRTSSAFLEALGGQRNATNPTLLEDSSTMANVVWSVTSDWSQGQPIQQYDQTSVNLYGSIVDTITDSVSDDLRLRLAQQHVALRSYPRQVASFTQIAGTSPSWGVDYDIGDTIRHRQWLEDGTLIVDSPMRIYGADTDHQQDGTRLVSPVLAVGG